MVNLLQCNTGKVHGHEGDWKVREVEYERERESELDEKPR